ncbi:MAG TPA: hypothetical protein PKA82_18045 [Pyrinomonadaceae bacterium]|nr:hypothetical protein [Pyrinomonadaceae bacterium]
MIREYVGKKAAEKLVSSKFGSTRAGKVAATILDDDRLMDLGSPDVRNLSDNADHPFFRKRILIYAVITNLISYLSVFLIPGIVSKFVLVLTLILPKGGLILLAPAFGFTMFATYSLLRIWRPENTDIAEHGAVMQSYETQSESLVTWKFWVVSCGVGGVNSLLLALTYLSITGELS